MKRPRWLMGGLSAAVLAIAIGCFPQPRHATAAIQIGGPFELVAPDGRIVTDQTFRGKWLLVYFGFTSCPESCPRTLVEIARALSRLDAVTAAEVQPLFITLDPRHDTREVLRDYVSSFDHRIIGLTGTPRQIATVVKAYGVYVQAHESEPNAATSLIDHSTYVYLMDPDGRFDRALDHEPPADDIVAALQAAMSRAAGAGRHVVGAQSAGR